MDIQSINNKHHFDQVSGQTCPYYLSNRQTEDIQYISKLVLVSSVQLISHAAFHQIWTNDLELVRRTHKRFVLNSHFKNTSFITELRQSLNLQTGGATRSWYFTWVFSAFPLLHYREMIYLLVKLYLLFRFSLYIKCKNLIGRLLHERFLLSRQLFRGPKVRESRNKNEFNSYKGVSLYGIVKFFSFDLLFSCSGWSFFDVDISLCSWTINYLNAEKCCLITVWSWPDRFTSSW